MPTQTQMTEGMLISLARELAIDIVPLEIILDTHKIGRDTLETLLKLPFFQGLLEEQKRLWNSALSTSERAKLKSLAMYEETLPEMYLRLHDREEGLNGKVEIMKLLAKVGGLDAKSDGTGAERVSITINMGELKTALPSAVTIDHSAEDV